MNHSSKVGTVLSLNHDAHKSIRQYDISFKTYYLLSDDDIEKLPSFEINVILVTRCCIGTRQNILIFVVYTLKLLTLWELNMDIIACRRRAGESFIFLYWIWNVNTFQMVPYWDICNLHWAWSYNILLYYILFCIIFGWKLDPFPTKNCRNHQSSTTRFDGVLKWV